MWLEYVQVYEEAHLAGVVYRAVSTTTNEPLWNKLEKNKNMKKMNNLQLCHSPVSYIASVLDAH